MNLKYFMKFLLTGFFIISSLISNAQKITKYYDADWAPVAKEKAVYYADFVKDGNGYKCTSHWIPNNAVRGTSTFADTIMENPIGVQVLYNKNGHAEDSSFFENGKAKYVFHYYPNNHLAMHYYLPDNAKEAIIEGYDEDGKKIKNYVFEKEADFKGGQKGWQSYVTKNSSKDLSVKDHPNLTATVQVEFTIEEDGSVSKIKIFKSSGYKEIDKDALRLVSESPSWNNAIQFNTPVKSLRIQPITYTLSDKK